MPHYFFHRNPFTDFFEMKLVTVASAFLPSLGRVNARVGDQVSFWTEDTVNEVTGEALKETIQAVETAYAELSTIERAVDIGVLGAYEESMSINNYEEYASTFFENMGSMSIEYLGSMVFHGVGADGFTMNAFYASTFGSGAKSAKASGALGAKSAKSSEGGGGETCPYDCGDCGDGTPPCCKNDPCKLDEETFPWAACCDGTYCRVKPNLGNFTGSNIPIDGLCYINPPLTPAEECPAEPGSKSSKSIGSSTGKSGKAFRPTAKPTNSSRPSVSAAPSSSAKSAKSSTKSAKSSEEEGFDDLCRPCCLYDPCTFPDNCCEGTYCKMDADCNFPGMAFCVRKTSSSKSGKGTKSAKSATPSPTPKQCLGKDAPCSLTNDECCASEGLSCYDGDTDFCSCAGTSCTEDGNCCTDYVCTGGELGNKFCESNGDGPPGGGLTIIGAQSMP